MANIYVSELFKKDFKVGDNVRKVDGHLFANGGFVAAISKVESSGRYRLHQLSGVYTYDFLEHAQPAPQHKFKVGDKVKRVNAGENSVILNGVISKVGYVNGRGDIRVVGFNGIYRDSQWELASTTKPHKHCEMIKAWADGAVIEVLMGGDRWVLAYQPSWKRGFTYRVKPEKTEAELEKESIIKEMDALKVRLDKLEV
jgi:hypothetical protein